MFHVLRARKWFIVLWFLSSLLAFTVTFITNGGLRTVHVPVYIASNGQGGQVQTITTTRTSVITQIYDAESGDISNGVAWSPDGKELAWSGPRVLEKFNILVMSTPDQRGPVRLFQGGAGWVEDIAWSPDGKWIAASTSTDSTWIWDASSGAVLTSSLVGYDALSWSPDSQRLATGGIDGDVNIYDLTSHRTMLHQLFDKNSTMSGNAWNSQGTMLVSASFFAGRAIVWDTRTGEIKYALQTDTERVSAVCWSPNGKWIATASTSSSDPGSVEVWSVMDHTVKRYAGTHEFGDPFAKVSTLAWSLDSRGLVGGTSNGLTWLLRMSSASVEVNTSHSGEVGSIGLSPNEEIASTGNDFTMQIWSPSHK